MAVILNKATVSSTFTLPDFTKKYNNVESNYVRTENLSTSFLKVKSSSKTFVISGQKVDVSLSLTNSSALTISNIQIADEIDGDATFDVGTLKINDVAYPDFDPVQGFAFPFSITQADVPYDITYTLTVSATPTIANLTVFSTLNYSIDDGTQFTEESNPVSLPIVNNAISITSDFDKSAVLVGQPLKITSVITNSGTLTNKEVVYINPIPAGTRFVADSVVIDDVSAPTLNPSLGLPLSDIAPNDTKRISFDLIVE